MSFMNSLFKSKDKKEQTTSSVNWIPLTSLEQIDTIKEQSKSENIFIFKHSTRCGISSMVIKRFEQLFDESMKNIKVYYLDLLSYRSISDEVGYKFQVMHQSPQLLVVKNGVAIESASHYDIISVDIQKYR